MAATAPCRLVAQIMVGTLCSVSGCSGDSPMSRAAVTPGASGDVAGAGAARGASGTQAPSPRTPASGGSGSTSTAPRGVVDPGADQCVGDTQGAEPVPVDMYIMLDRSGSMQGKTGTGQS